MDWRKRMRLITVTIGVVNMVSCGNRDDGQQGSQKTSQGVSITKEQVKEQSPEEQESTLHEELGIHAIGPYSDKEKEAVKMVFKEFGDLYIKPSTQGTDGRLEMSRVKIRGDLPWSGYWYPKRSQVLFLPDNAPLKKLDRLLQRLGKEGLTAKWEAQHHDMDFYAEWEGLCDAWALASVITKEPKQPLVWEGIEFQISDLKALAIKLVEGMKPTIYGVRYLGNYITDGEIQDLRPEAFHRLVLALIGERNQSLVMDDDPGPEIWAKPLYEMSWTIKPDPEKENAYLVKAWPKMVNMRNEVNNALTTMFDLKAPEYEYRLYVDPNLQNEAGEWLVVHGEWVGDSLSSHPDMIFLPNTQYSPLNSELAKNIDVVKEVLQKAKMLPPESSGEHPTAVASSTSH